MFGILVLFLIIFIVEANNMCLPMVVERFCLIKELELIGITTRM